ncbi:MAG: hypothetical protein ACRD59_19445 [Candidatus Acidiferrales bacterium]
MNASISGKGVERKSPAVAAIVFAGLVSGALDIAAAFVTWAPQGVSPGRILKGIASGLLGPAAFHGGSAIAALGLALHFLIALSAAAVFYAASQKLSIMTRQPVLSGVLYGVCVYIVMYWIVMPLSRFHPGHTLKTSIIAIITHVICVGLPISLVVRRYSR